MDEGDKTEIIKKAKLNYYLRCVVTDDLDAEAFREKQGLNTFQEFLK